MKRVCAYCHTVINPGDSPGEAISHGICNDCSRRVLSKVGVDIARYLDMLDAPVILVNEDARVHDTNLDAVMFIGRSLDPILGIFTANSLRCTHPGQPGGCGRTVMCSGCVIRNAVRTTYETGEPVDRCPAVLQQGDPDQTRPIDLLISTRKAGSIVLVRIEPVAASTPETSAV
ncbi:MAG: hypothetical protein ABSG28_10200 [Methanoregula sp.]|uniref:hypothetical protein n=1 Tax=Methanoregula sp. TaxID=2052170 RepID=UPI003C259E00